MKKINLHIMTMALVSIALSSCMKKYDPSTYAPPLNIGGYTSSNAVAKESLVGYWSFNGSLIDSISNTTAVSTGTAYTLGVKGQALQGAKDAYALIDPSNDVKNMHSFTVMSWVNSPQNTDGIVGLVDISNTNEFWGNMTIFFENGATPTTANLKVHVKNDTKEAWLGNYTINNPWNKWMNVAVSYDEATSTFVIYVDGAKLATQKVDGFGAINFKNVGKIVLGTVHFQTTPSQTSATGKQDWASYLKGQMDEVRIYNKSLSADDIGAIVKLEGRGK